MPRRKNIPGVESDSPIDYRPGSQTLDIVMDYERRMRLIELERDLGASIPDFDLSDGKFLPALQAFRIENDRQPRGNITLTLSLRTIELLAWLENMTVMKRGKVVDWMLHGVWPKYLDYKEARMDEELKERKRRKAKMLAASESESEDDDE